MMPTVNELDRRQGRHVRQQLHQLAALLPVAGDLLHRPVRAQPRRARQPAARRRLRPASTTPRRSPTWLQAAGLPHDPHRQVPERLRQSQRLGTCRRAGTSGTRHSVAPRTERLRLPAEPERLADGSLRRPEPGRLQARRLHRQGGRGDRRAARRRAAVLPRRRLHWRRTPAAPNPNPQPPADCARHREAGAPPRGRLRRRAAAEAAELQRGRRLRQAGWRSSGLRAADRRRDRRTTSATTAAGSSRCSSVDEGVERILEALERQGELDNTLLVFTSDNGFFAGEHRVRMGKNRVYEEAIRVPLVIRGPGMPAGRDGRRARRSTPTSRRRSSTPPARRRAGSRTAARCCRSPPTRSARARPRAADRAEHSRRRRRRRRAAERRTSPRAHRALHLRPATRPASSSSTTSTPTPYQLQNQIANPAYDRGRGGAGVAARRTLRSCAGEGCRTKPDLKLKLPRSRREHGRSCRRPKDFVARVRGSASPRLARASFAVGAAGRRPRRGGPFKKRIRPRLLRDKAPARDPRDRRRSSTAAC